MSLTRKQAADWLEKIARQRLLVAGDLMLDRYVHGSVERISPEAPVPVVRVRRERMVPGGACNVAWNARALGAQAAIWGVAGEDRGGAELEALLEQGGVDTTGLQKLARIRTTIKTRIIADHQQVVRVDWEDDLSLADAEMTGWAPHLKDAVSASTAVVMADYAKGFVRQPLIDAILAAASARGIPVGLDPKPRADYALDFRGVTFTTPNRREAFLGAGQHDPGAAEHPLEDRPLRQAADALLAKWGPKHLLVTLGPQGMLLVDRESEPKHVPTRAREVYDVSGAGDTVVAVCALALGAGADYPTAAEIANYAAGVVVAKIGTATCSPDELLAQVPE